MRIAAAICEGRISPVFDVAGRLLVVDFEEGQETSREEIPLQSEEMTLRAAQLAELGVERLICGAISRPLEMAVAAAGVEVIPHICGPVEEILAALQSGALEEPTYKMPGCCGRRRFRGGGGRGGRGQGRRGGRI